MEKRIIVLGLALAVAACGRGPIEVADGGGEDGRTVELIAVAPDGTHLWRYRDSGLRNVYFASTGTQSRVNCGKNCWRSETVGTTEDNQ